MTTIDVNLVNLVEILIGFFVATLSAVGILVSYLSKSDKQSFENFQTLYDELKATSDAQKQEIKDLNDLVREYKKSQELMQSQMVNLNYENAELKNKYQQREKEITKLLEAKDREITKLKHDLFELERKVKLLEKIGTGQLPPRKV